MDQLLRALLVFLCVTGTFAGVWAIVDNIDKPHIAVLIWYAIASSIFVALIAASI